METSGNKESLPLRSEPKGVLVWLNRVFLLTATGLALWYLLRHRQEIVDLIKVADINLLLAGFSIIMLFELGLGIASTLVLRSTGIKTPVLRILPATMISGLGKYIPGKVWVVTMRTTFLSRHSIPVSNVLTSSTIEHILIIATAVMLFLFTAGGTAQALGAVEVSVVVIVLMGLIIFPDSVHKAVNRSLSFVGARTVEKWPDRSHTAILTAVYIALWLLLGLGVFLVTRSFSPELPLVLYLSVAGLYALSVVAGFLVIIAPGGIGVREGILVLGLASHIGTSQAVFVSVALRIVTSITQLSTIGMVIAFDWAHYRSKGDRPGNVDMKDL